MPIMVHAMTQLELNINLAEDSMELWQLLLVSPGGNYYGGHEKV